MTLIAMVQADPPAGRWASSGELFARYTLFPNQVWIPPMAGVEFICLAGRTTFATTR